MIYVFSQLLEDRYAEKGKRGVVNLWLLILIDAPKSLIKEHWENNKEGNTMKLNNTDLIMHNTIFAWIAFATAAVLLVPLIAMRFTDEVNWTLSDFIVMGILLFAVSSLFVLAARKIPKTSHRIAVGAVFGLGLLYIWAELSVGIFTSIGS